LRVSADGGEPTVLTTPNVGQGEADHQWPEFLPNGRAVLFTITRNTGGIDNADVAVLDLRTGARKTLVHGGSHARYVPSSHLLYAVSGAIRAVPFDLERLEVLGAPITVLPSVTTTPLGAAQFDVGQDGTLLYEPVGATASHRTLVWVDRHGREEPIDVPAREYSTPSISPDGKRIAVEAWDQQQDLWMYDLPRGPLTRFTTAPALDASPVWTPDGTHLIFNSYRSGTSKIYWQAANGTFEPELLFSNDKNVFPTSISGDGTRLFFMGLEHDLMTLAMDGSRRLFSVVHAPGRVLNGMVSPDGRWLAYEANDTGQYEIYVRPFPDTQSRRWLISGGGGGIRPVWAKNGRELYYVAPPGALMSVAIGPGATWKSGTPTKLFGGGYFYGGGPILRNTYDVAKDGRFLMVKPSAEGQTSTLVLVLNWSEELKQHVPTR
jgi:serine/threonine-protein kinase